MNRWQHARQIKHLLSAAVWPDSELVFGFLAISAGLNDFPSRRGNIFPAVVISPGSGSNDPSDPRIHSLSWNLWLMTRNQGDGFGEAALVGANRTGGSLGRGLLEVEEQLQVTLEEIGDETGLSMVLYASSSADSIVHEDYDTIALNSFAFSSKATTRRFYHPPTRLAATTPGGGVAALTWRLPPDRFDRLELVLRRAAGATPPATATSGTGVTLSGPLAVSVSDTPGVGTFSYSLFALYDEINTPPVTATTGAVSAAETLTVAVV